MTGGIVQLVANKHRATAWLQTNPQITFFKTVYRRHTNFAREFIPIAFDDLNFGKQSSITLPLRGDLIHRIFLVFDTPFLKAVYPNSKSDDLINYLTHFQFTDHYFRNAFNLQTDVGTICEHIECTLQQYYQLKKHLTSGQLSTTCSKMELLNHCIQLTPQYATIYQIIQKLQTNNNSFRFIDANYIHQSKIAIDNLIPLVKKDNHVFENTHYQTLKTYNTIIQIIQNLVRTKPLLFVKTYPIDNPNYDLYQSNEFLKIQESKCNCFIDPNYEGVFQSDTYQTNDVHQVNLRHLFDDNHPSSYTLPYLHYCNDVIHNIKHQLNQSMNRLFDHYSTSLFDNTRYLFWDHSTSLSNIYCYLAPTTHYADNEKSRIKNVFNINIWYFYFFQYLDYFNETAFADYLVLHFHLTNNQLHFLRTLIQLLKINLQYYMNEISYLANDLTTRCSSVVSTDSLKVYTPAFTDDNHNVRHGLLAITYWFHRNHCPSIIEMMDYIFTFIEQCTSSMINQYLNVTVALLPLEAELVVKKIVRSFYQCILNYFNKVYDTFHFQTTKTNDETTDPVVARYVHYFLTQPENNQFYPNQTTIAKTVQQMEFIFVVEKLNIDCFNLLYNHLFNYPQTIPTDPLITRLVEKITTHATISTNHYSTTNIHRYAGRSYLDTNYLSRDDVQIDSPLIPPVPIPAYPYGINERYYPFNDCSAILVDYANVPTGYHHNTYPAINNINYYTLKHSRLVEQLNWNNGGVDRNHFCLVELYQLLQKPTSNWHLSYIDQKIEYLRNNLICDPKILCQLSTTIHNDQNVDHYLPFLEKWIEQTTIPISIVEVNNYLQTVQTSNSHLLDQLLVERVTYFTQYYYYVQHRSLFDKLYQLTDCQNKNAYQIAAQLDCLLLVEPVSSLVYLYPQNHSAIMEATIKHHQRLSDLKQIIACQYVYFLNNDLKPAYTVKDVIDWINAQFVANSQTIADVLQQNIWLNHQTFAHSSFSQLIDAYINELLTHILHINLFTEQINSNIIARVQTILDVYIDQLETVKRCAIVIMNRSAVPRTAWIRKLAHFLIQTVTLKIGETVVDQYTSDWMEVYHKLTTKEGYLKMIGHRADLICFDNLPKQPSTIYLPLLFYFNKHLSHALPLVTTNNHPVSIGVQLRHLEDVAYKEMFAVFEGCARLNNAHLMVEYIYLDATERNLFCTIPSEYLIDETTIVTSYPTPVLKNGIESNYQQYQLRKIVDHCSPFNNQLVLTDEITTNAKEWIVDHHLYHPTKLLVTLFKQPAYTKGAYHEHLFNGEKQWNNYCVYPYFDLTAVRSNEKEYYQQMIQKLTNKNDALFGWQALLKTTHNVIQSITPTHTVIPLLHLMHQTDTVFNHRYSMMLELKEKLQSIGAPYPIIDNMVTQVLCSIACLLKITLLPSIPRIDNLFQLIEHVNFYCKDLLNRAILTSSRIYKTVSQVYALYVDAVNNYLVYLAYARLPSNVTDFSFILDYLLMVSVECVPFVGILKEKYVNNEWLIPTNTSYKSLIYGLMIVSSDTLEKCYQSLVPYAVIHKISKLLNNAAKIQFNEHHKPYLHYPKLMVKNTKINPLFSGYHCLNECALNPINTPGIVWNAANAYQYLSASGSAGINIHSAALYPFCSQPSGSINLSKINRFHSVYTLHPAMGANHPSIEHVLIALHINLVRFYPNMFSKEWCAASTND